MAFWRWLHFWKYSGPQTLPSFHGKVNYSAQKCCISSRLQAKLHQTATISLHLPQNIFNHVNLRHATQVKCILQLQVSDTTKQIWIDICMEIFKVTFDLRFFSLTHEVTNVTTIILYCCEPSSLVIVPIDFHAFVYSFRFRLSLNSNHCHRDCFPATLLIVRAEESSQHTEKLVSHRRKNNTEEL